MLPSMWRWWNSSISRKNAKMMQLWEIIRQFLQKPNVYLPYNPAVTLLGIYPREIKTHTKIRINHSQWFYFQHQKRRQSAVLQHTNSKLRTRHSMHHTWAMKKNEPLLTNSQDGSRGNYIELEANPQWLNTVQLHSHTILKMTVIEMWDRLMFCFQVTGIGPVQIPTQHNSVPQRNKMALYLDCGSYTNLHMGQNHIEFYM